ncbi:MAG TPA: glutathione S-transferase family protein [Burkholderiaceae bacterium]|nr:glutathione S-transferase family protein [Burkholderiaceae bacterium]
MAIKLYSWPQSSGTRVSWALEELGLPYEYIELDAKKLEHRAQAYLAINPQGKVPGLVDGELTFFESGAILLHLGEKYGVEKNLWPAAGGQARADALCWTVWAVADLGSYMMQYAYHGLDSPVSYRPEDRSKACAEYSRSQFGRCLDALQARLQEREYLLGTFSLADVAAASWLLIGSKLGIQVASHAGVAEWVKRCSERPACRRAR